MNSFFQESLFAGLALSLVAYVIGMALKKKLKIGIFHPLLISIIISIAVLAIGNVEYEVYQESAKYLSYLLTPATVCLAIPLYEQWELLKKNYLAVVCGLIAGVITSLATVFGLAVLFHLSHREYVTLLPKSITTAIGMGVSEELGGCVRNYGSCHHHYRSSWKCFWRYNMQNISYQRTYFKGTCLWGQFSRNRNCQGNRNW